MTDNIFDDLRAQLDKDFLSNPPSPQNTLTRDFLLATINYVEKVNIHSANGRVVMNAIDHVTVASVSALINLAFRLYGLCTVTEPEGSILMAKYIQSSFDEEFLKQSFKMSMVQKSELEAKKEQKL